MSMLAPDVHNELAQLLQALQAKDNGVRSQAEEHLHNNWTNTRPEVLLMGLAEQIAASKDTSVRRLLAPLDRSFADIDFHG
jgi:pantothenate kinase